MTNKRSAKRALLMSLLSMLLCVTMLVGTTFAWFTDSVTSGNNIIKSGTLDIELEYYKDGKWQTVNGATDLFGTELWEPGHAEVVYFKLSNLGTLALKYQLGINVISEVGSTNVNGVKFNLSDYIEFGVVEGVDGSQNPYADRESAIDALDNSRAIKNGFSKSGYMLENDPEVYLALVVYMPEEVGNEANAKTGENVPTIDLGVNVIATQYTAENDSYGPDYDEGAVYYDVAVSTVEDLYTQVANATDDIVIGIDGKLTLTQALSRSGLKSIKFVGISDDATIDQATYNMHFSGAAVTFDDLILTHGEKAYGNGGQTSTAFAVWDAKEVNYINCTFNRSVGTIHAPLHNFIGCTFNGVYNPDNSNSEYLLYICDGQDYNVKDCVFNATNRGAILFYNDGGAGTDTLNISDCLFLGDIIADKTAVEIHNNSATQVYNVNISNVSVATTVINGLYRIKPGNVGEVNVKVDGVSTVNTVSGVDTADKLANALTGAGLAGAGNTVIQLSGDIDLSGQTWTPVKVDGYHGADVVTIDGNGATIKGLSAPLFAGGFAGGSGIVIKNLTIADSEIVSANTLGSGAFIECVDSMDIITLSNCHLKNSTVSGSRTGGLIGWTSGYNVQNDGPVNSYVNVLDCTVVNCTVIGRGSVGAIIGHAGANPATYHTIKNCNILDTELIAIDAGSLRVGAIVGTANVGEVKIEKCTWDAETTMTQYSSEADYNNKTNSINNDKAYGRLELGSTGKFEID